MKKLWLYLLVFAEIFLSGAVYSESVTYELSSELLRLHIIAESDSQEHQEEKEAVRDFIIDYINKNEMTSKKEVICAVKDTQKAVNDFLKSIDAGYECAVTYGVSEFPSKIYNNIAIPSGNYECIKVVLGNGNGKNWWCVAYPPLCFTESVVGNISSDGYAKLKESLSDEAYNIINSNSAEYKIKFKSVELFNKIFKKKGTE